MKRLKKGPELKMPELKVPDFLSDLYWDLRDRRLLPLVALAIVAIVAVPFLLGGGSKEEPPVASPATASTVESANASSLTVVEAQPGLRDYRKRLRGRSETDPFKQRYTAPTLKGTKLGGGEGGGDGGGESSTSTSSTTTSTSTSTSTDKVTKTKVTKTENGKTTVTTETDGEEAAEPQLTLYAFAIDAKITRTSGTDEAGKQTSEPVVRHRVIPPAALPSEKEQVATYMGLNPKTRLPLFLVADEVSSVFGEGKCLAGTQSCQLIEIEPGFPETFVFGPEATRFKIEILKVEPVTAGKYRSPQ